MVCSRNGPDRVFRPPILVQNGYQISIPGEEVVGGGEAGEREGW
jgi:hypothetical protein